MNKVNPNIFRSYDIRGIYPDDFQGDVAYNFGLAYANLFPDLKKIVVARDMRKSGLDLKKSLIKGLIDGGKEVFEIEEIVTTPIMCFGICHYNMDGGVMITASHNTNEWNGLKFKVKNAYPVLPDGLKKLQDLIEENKLKKSDKPGERKTLKPVDDYINFVSSKIRLKKPLKIIIDSGNGSCGYVPEKIFKRIGCDVQTLFGEPDDSFPHHMADPYEEKNLQDLKKKVMEDKADIGFAYDGDGDRIGIIDNLGNIISGDEYLLILAREVLEKKVGPVVCETRTSQAFLDEVHRLGAETYFTVGYHTAILDKIVEKNGVFGGETTGHVFFPLDYYLYDDAIFTSLKVAEIAAKIENFGKYIRSLPRYFITKEIFIDYPDETKKQALNRFIQLIKTRGYKFIDVDGARIIFERGWGVVRISNTSPMIKTKFEGRTKEDLIKIEKEVIGLMKEVDINLSAKNYEELERNY